MLDLVTAYVLTNLKIFPMPAHALIQCFTQYYCLITPDIKKKKFTHGCGSAKELWWQLLWGWNCEWKESKLRKLGKNLH